MQTQRSSAMVDVALASVVLMWASAFPLFKVVWREVDPVAFTAVRFAAMAAVSVGVLIALRGRARVRRADVPTFVLSGLTGYFLYQLAFILGLDRTTAVASAVLVSTHPIFSVAVAWALGRERPSRVTVLGMAVGFLGVAVFLRAWQALSAVRPGDLLSLAAAAAFGAYGVINQPLSRRYPSWYVMALGLVIGGTLVAVVGLPAVADQRWDGLPASAWLILGYAAVGPVPLAYALWNWAIHRRGIGGVVAWGFAVPVVAAALAVVGLGEEIRPEQVIGAVLVLAGLVLTRGGSRAAEESEAATGEAR